MHMLSDEKLHYCEAAEYILAHITNEQKNTDTALILGSGLGGFSACMTETTEIPYSSIPAFPLCMAPGHAGKLIFGKLGDKNIVCLSGRSHYYDTASLDGVRMYIRVLRMLGVKKLLVTNAAGGINTSFKTGDFMLITDHINMLPNPLVGENLPELGVRFPDMSYAYSPRIRLAAKETAKQLGISLREGVYIGVSGPSYETPAEIRAFRIMGADAVGMSTVPEIILANHCGIEAAGISLISNMAAGVLQTRLTEEEITIAGELAAPAFKKLVTALLNRI